MNNECHYQRQSSLGQKLKSSICCFAGIIDFHDRPLDNEEHYFDKLPTPKTPRTPKTPPIWHKKSGLESPDLSRSRSRGFMARIGRKHRQSHSADFSYDPSSYALNFQDDTATNDEEFPIRTFSSRLRASPSSVSRSSSTANYTEDPSVRVPIVAYS